MWKAFLGVVRKRCSLVLHVLDRFHVAQLLSKAVDTVRRDEMRGLRAAGRQVVPGGEDRFRRFDRSSSVPRPRLLTANTSGIDRGARILWRRRSGSDETDDERLIELDQLTPQELFSRAWQDSYGSEVDEQTLKDFAVLLQEVQQEGEQP